MGGSCGSDLLSQAFLQNVNLLLQQPLAVSSPAELRSLSLLDCGVADIRCAWTEVVRQGQGPCTDHRHVAGVAP